MQRIKRIHRIKRIQGYHIYHGKDKKRQEQQTCIEPIETRCLTTHDRWLKSCRLNNDKLENQDLTLWMKEKMNFYGERNDSKAKEEDAILKGSPKMKEY